jgi:hypothetical protein
VYQDLSEKYSIFVSDIVKKSWRFGGKAGMKIREDSMSGSSSALSVLN